MYDYIVIGSGFGGSVSAMRLAEKGYKVAVLEKGKRYRTHDFPPTNWNLRKFLWMPRLKLYGIQMMTLFKHVFVLHGGGSLVYANQLLVPPDEVFQKKEWGPGDWKTELMPFYERAKQMLGATPSPSVAKAYEILAEIGREIRGADTFHVNDVGVFFGEPGKTVPDPYFNGEGPQRTGCKFCGACMIGCPVGAKNTLDKNYLYLAENKFGVTILLVMQTEDSYLRLEYARRWWRFGRRTMNTILAPGSKKVPSYIPVANEIARRMGKKINGQPMSAITEALFDISSTAHILGGCVMGATRQDGVVDFKGKIFGYPNLYVADGSNVPVNLGVNPSLTITAIAEYIMSQIPDNRQRVAP